MFENIRVPPSPPPPPPPFIRPIYPTDQGYFLTQSWFEMHPLLYVHAQLSEWDMTDMHVIYFVYNSALVKQIFIPYRKGKHPIAPGPGPARPIPYKYFKTPSIQILYHCSSDRLLSGGYAVYLVNIHKVLLRPRSSRPLPAHSNTYPQVCGPPHTHADSYSFLGWGLCISLSFS